MLRCWLTLNQKKGVSVIKKAILSYELGVLMKIFPLIFASIFWVSNSFSQGVGCDEGVIRMPDRSGTIQICSSLAAKVPQLSKQLSDVSKSLGTQQQQLTELTRLVKGLNGISHDLSSDRQSQLLINLAKELERSSSRGESISKRDFEVTIDRVDELNGIISKTSSTPAGANEIKKAMSADLGVSISRLEFSSAASQLDDIKSQLKAIEQGVAEVRQDTTAIRQDMAKMQIQSINTMKNISAEIRALGNLDALIANPTSVAQKYHNARILIQRGEVDRALPIYEDIASNKLIFADPIIDLVTLLNRQYGPVAASKYIESKLSAKMPKAAFEYAKLLLKKDVIEDQQSIVIISKLVNLNPNLLESFPPLSKLMIEKINFSEAVKFDIKNWAVIKQLTFLVKESINSGQYYAFFIDQTRAEKDLSSFEFSKFSTNNAILNKITGDWYGLDYYSKFSAEVGCNQESELEKRARVDIRGHFCYFRKVAKGEGLIDCPLTPESIEQVGKSVVLRIKSATPGNAKEFQKYQVQPITEKCMIVKFDNLTDTTADLTVDQNCENVPQDKRAKVESRRINRCTYF